MGIIVRITLTNETEGHGIAEFEEDPHEWYAFDRDEPIDMGALYRELQSEYGVCRSSVYVDRAEGPPKRCGWYFESRKPYDDTGESYLRGAWCTVYERTPAQYEAVEL